MASGDFKVFVSDLSCSPEEWRRALKANDSELPELTEDQKEWAKRFGVEEKQYARSLLAGLYGNERQRKRAQALGAEVGKVLDALSSGYAVCAVLWQGSRQRWLVRVQTPESVVGIAISFELADDVLDSGILSEIGRLKELVLTGVGRQELFPKQA
jgi:hypothetical protein